MIVAARATGGSAPVTPTSTSTLTTRPPGTNLPAPTPPQWTLFDEDHATGAIVDAINGARQVVDAEFFAVAGAGKGAQLTAALVAAARRGVEVNLIADFTSLVAPPPGAFIRMRRDLEQAGAHVVLTSRAPFSRRTRAFPGLGNVDHRKVISVDSTTAFTGGMNFTTITDSGFRDSMVRLSGIPAARLAADQLDRWQRVGGAVSATHRTSVRDALGDAPQIPSDANELAVLSNAPEQRRFDLSNAYRDLIRGAQRRIWLTTPGLSDQSLIGDINAAAKRGVDVRIITSGAPILGVRLLNWVGRSHLKQLSGVGGSGYEIPETLHRKALVVDDTAILGSYNLTARSRLHDHEIGVRSSDPAFVQAIAGVVEADRARATQLDPAKVTGLGAWMGDLLAQRLKVSY